MTDIEQKGTLEFCAPKFLFCCEELPFVRMHIFSVKAVSGWMKMKKTLVGILVFDMIMGMLCLWAVGKRQDTTAPASQEVSTGKIAGEEDVAKKIALTFDDGPHPRYTEQLLDGLKERNVVATFFCDRGECAELSKYYPERTGGRTSDRKPYVQSYPTHLREQGNVPGGTGKDQ